MGRKIDLGDDDTSFDPTRISAKCLVCRSPQVVVVKVDAEGRRTKSRMGLCTNRECFRYTDPASTTTWEKE